MNYDDIDKEIVDNLITEIIQKEKRFIHGKRISETEKRKEIKDLINKEVFKNDN